MVARACLRPAVRYGIIQGKGGGFMALIRVDDLTFSYPGSYDDVFSHTSFQIDTDWKLGFVGRNGRGKTTFLQLLLGKHEYRGSITSPVAFDYFPYLVDDAAALTNDVFLSVCPDAQSWQILRELSLLQVGEDTLWRPFATLSQGEQTKLLLAALFLNEGRFLLIDEPTNHLDTEGRRLVARYLNRKKGFILVSHDRAFLDECVDHILSINRASIQVMQGNFSTFMENFARRQNFELAENERLSKDIDRLQSAARRASGWSDALEGTKNAGYDSGYIGHKSAKMMKRAKSIETRRERAVEEKAALLHDLEREEPLKLAPLAYTGGALAQFSNVAPCYDGKPVCAPVNFTIEPGERIVLSGKNGSGKSSVLKLLLGQDIDHDGALFPARGLKISYVPQDASFLRGTVSELCRQAGIDEARCKTILRKMDFTRPQLEKPMESYSAGQKKKVLLAKSLCESAHLYVWDEPLNYIDVYSRMQIEALLLEFAPTMLFVEHDRAFQAAIATKTVCLAPAKEKFI